MKFVYTFSGISGAKQKPRARSRNGVREDETSMVLPNTGSRITLLGLRAEFGGPAGTRTAMSDYYSGGAYASNVSGVPSSGALRLSTTFGGKAKPVTGPSEWVSNGKFASQTLPRPISRPTLQPGHPPRSSTSS